ncbi:BglG family transcription antiterminator [Companilactobacillus futsaii]|uniref:BglG family transcription antiterminator n=1 Tax=Companilactobacillus futsaii TaxID=938155 RepID=UPI00189EA83B|nr:PRD domain-containing protein [Companilactobacillus futsaii]
MTSVNKQQELIYYLLDTDNYTTSSELANNLNVSSKTIYRMISKINNESDKVIISSKRGLGYRVENDYLLRKQLDSHIEHYVTPVERRNRILKRLLLNSPRFIKEEGLWGEYYVGDSVRSLDKKVMRSILSRFNLKLNSSGNLYKVTGSEQNIRSALMELVDDKNIVDLTQVDKNGSFKQKYDVDFVKRQINYVEDKLGITFPYPYNINIFTHLYILLGRYRGTNTKLSNNDKYSDTNIGTNPLLVVSKEVITNIPRYLGISVDKREINYVYEYLLSSNFNGQNNLKPEVDDQVINVTKDLVKSVYYKLGVKDYNKAIIDNLENHIRPLLNRLRNNIKVNNNLLEQIKMEYGDILNAVVYGSKIVQKKYSLNEIDENEAGYITLYFAQNIEENRRKINVLVMCATGIGTSQLLKTKIHNTFPNISIYDVIGTSELSDFKTKNIDLIVSTIVPKESIDVPVVLVSSLFTEKDKSLVRNKIRKISNK